MKGTSPAPFAGKAPAIGGTYTGANNIIRFPTELAWAGSPEGQEKRTTQNRQIMNSNLLEGEDGQTMMTKRCVLLTEDAANNGQHAVETLQSCGYTVHTCPRDGQEVLRAVALLRPDYVVMDLFMPRIDAVGVLQDLRESGISVPYTLVTLNVENDRMTKQALDSGADFCLLKPYDARILVQRLEQLPTMRGAADLPKPSPFDSADDGLTGDEWEIPVSDILKQIGVPAHISGYDYLRSAIIFGIRDPKILRAVTKSLYPKVAEIYDTTPSRVERAIRHAIETSWERGDVDLLASFFGYTVSFKRSKPTNSEFIAMISDRLRLRQKNYVA
ncbi:MAG: sporulation transcription factor Spo0A [Oscillospiraceae bacterium]|jgi:two-component system response regulator (stage 0 sporulation protein A)|nr:sporulation transcription factor Spo0A [Oscillospiraceae bacterium]